MITLDQFIAKYQGVHIDEDGYYGAQCWDVSARYAREVVGCPSFPTGSGGAEGLFRIFAQPIPQYFDRIANNKSDPNQLPNRGDVIVWDASFSPPWGHTAVCLSADRNGVTVLEQNGNNPGGVSYIKTRGWTGVSGWLRPKVKEVIIMPTANEVRSAFQQYDVGTPTDQQVVYYSQRGWNVLLDDILKYVNNVKLAYLNNANVANQSIIALNAKIAELEKNQVDPKVIQDLKDQALKASEKAKSAQLELEKMQQKEAEDKLTAETWLRRLGQWLQKYLPNVNKEG